MYRVYLIILKDQVIPIKYLIFKGSAQKCVQFVEEFPDLTNKTLQLEDRPELQIGTYDIFNDCYHINNIKNMTLSIGIYPAEKIHNYKIKTK